jgi:transcription elongation GreA/GreB family factor
MASPIAKALLGRLPGDIVEFQTPRGTRRLKIVDTATDP